MTTIQETPTPIRVAETDHDGAGAPSELPEVLPIAEGEPTFIPPAALVEATAAADSITAWHNAQTVTSLWTNSSANNGWAAIAGVGFLKVNNAEETSHQTMLALLSLAHATGAKVNVRVESDNLIHEVYSL